MPDSAIPQERYSLRDWGKETSRQKAKGILGAAMAAIFRARAARLAEEDFTAHGRRGLLDRLIGAGMAYRALRRGSLEDIAEYHRRYWGGKSGTAFHEEAPVRFEAAFKKFYTPVIDELEKFLPAHDSMSTICEIGTGAGLLLEYLAERFPQIKRLIGIDLSEETTAENRRKYPSSRMEFAAGDAAEYIKAHGEPNWVYVTHNGVFEYFAPEAVMEVLSLVAGLRPAALVTIEPLGLDHDLETQCESWPYGQEFSFSHNYPHMLKEAGFEILYRHEVNVYGVRVILLLSAIA